MYVSSHSCPSSVLLLYAHAHAARARDPELASDLPRLSSAGGEADEWDRDDTRGAAGSNAATRARRRTGSSTTTHDEHGERGGGGRNERYRSESFDSVPGRVTRSDRCLTSLSVS